SQSMCKCAQGLGLDAGQVDQAHALEVGRTLSEQRLAAIDNHLMSTLHQARRQLNKEGLSAAVSGRNAAPAADSNAELASAYRIWAGGAQRDGSLRGNLFLQILDVTGVVARTNACWQQQRVA